MMNENKEVELDVRPLIKVGIPPLGTIMNTMNQLEKGQSLRLFAPFEPMPLYSILEQQGYTHEMTKEDDGSFVILFTPRSGRS